MRRRALVITFLLGVAVAARAETTSAELVGEWSSGRPSHADWRLFYFRADHSWNGIAHHIHGAAKGEPPSGKKLELIYYSDYEHKIIFDSSKRAPFCVLAVSDMNDESH